MTSFLLTIGVYFFVQLILVLSANLQLGLMGMANLGFVLFLGMGAYTTAIFSMGPPNASSLQHYFFGAALPFPIPLLLGVAVGALLGLVMGLIALHRMRGHYLAIMTLAMLTIVWTIVDGFPNFLGGDNGLDAIPQPLASLTTTYTSYQVVFLCIAAFCCTCCFWFNERFFKSPLGRMAKAIRENEAAATTLGINPFRIRLLATVCGSGMAALAGGLLAEYVTVWGMQPWSYAEIFPAAAAMIIGGRANNWGAALGTFATFVLVGQGLPFLPVFADNPELSYSIQWIIYGLALIGFLWFRPRGFIPEPKTRWKRAPSGVVPPMGTTLLTGQVMGTDLVESRE